MDGKNKLRDENNALSEILIGIIILLLFFVFGDKLADWANMELQDGWINIFKIPLTFLFATGAIIFVPIAGVALIIDGYKRNKKRIDWDSFIPFWLIASIILAVFLYIF